MRPALRAGVVAQWRRVDTVQLQFGSLTFVITGLPIGAVTFFRMLDGTYDLGQLCAAVDSVATLTGFNVRMLVDTLVQAGVVYDAGQLPRLDTYEAAQRERFLHEAISWPISNDPRTLFERRQACVVRLHTCTSLTVATALLLAASGMAQFVLDPRNDNDATVGTHDIAPGSFTAESLGTPRWRAARDLLRTHGAKAITQQSPPPICFALVDTSAYDELATPFRTDTAYLAFRIAGAAATVGPLVLPGRTACARCSELHLRDTLASGTDDALSATLPSSVHAALQPPATTTALALAASHAAAAVLEHVDNTRPDRFPALAGHVLGIDLPGPQITLTALAPHRQCGCCWEAA